MHRQQQERYTMALEDAMTRCREAADFSEVFAQRIEWIEGYTPGSVATALHAKAALYERYVVDLVIPVTLNEKRDGVSMCGTAQVFLREITEIRGPEVRYNVQADRELGSKEWRELIGADGDFSSIGIQLRRDAPVAGFGRAWREDPYTL